MSSFKKAFLRGLLLADVLPVIIPLIIPIIIPMNLAVADPEMQERFNLALPSLIDAYSDVAVAKKECQDAKTESDRRCIKWTQENRAFEQRYEHLFLRGSFHVTELGNYGAEQRELKLEEEILRTLGAKTAELCKKMSVLEKAFREEKMLPLINEYAWAIPTDAALDMIKKYGPILELGAGSGYWSFLLKELGTDVVAYDDQSWEENKFHKPRNKWLSELRVGNETAVLEASNSERTLFISWPPTTAFAFLALSKYRGRYFIYIGEMPETTEPLGPAMAEPVFFELLKSKYKRIEEVTLPHWPGYSDHLYVFERI